MKVKMEGDVYTLDIILWIIISIFVVIGIIMIVGIIKFRKEVKQVNHEYVVQLIKEKKADKNVALSIRYNDEKWLDINENILLPLASTVKIIIAIEFARQAADGQINPNQKIPIETLEKFNIPKTDGGAHQAWLDSLKVDEKVKHTSLLEIASGMINYSSNANTDFLIQILGLENINQVPKSLGIHDHEPMYPIVSSLYIPIQLMKNKKLTEQQTIIEMRNMNMDEYRKMAIDIHHKWIDQPLTRLEKSRLVKKLSMGIQRAWSDRLPHGTTAGYASIMAKLNSKTYFSKEVHKYLDPLLEQVMENPNNQELFIHAGQKGGSTSFAVTLAMYATDKDYNQTALALFTNNLSPIEQVKVSRSIKQFQRKFLKDRTFQTYVKNELSNAETEFN